MTDSDRSAPVRDLPRWPTAILFLLAMLAMALLPIVTFRFEFDDGGGNLDLTANGFQLLLARNGRFVSAAALLTLVVLVLGAATATLRGPVRAGVALGAALLAAIIATATAVWSKDGLTEFAVETTGTADSLGLGYGLWIVVGLMGVVVAANAPALTARLTAGPARASAA